jgi:arylsulfatase A-like enzyme
MMNHSIDALTQRRRRQCGPDDGAAAVSPAMREGWPARKALPALTPVRTLFVGSTVAAVVVAIAGVASLAGTADVGRLRELELLHSLRVVVEDHSGLNPLAIWPALLSKPFELHAAGSLCVFLALSIVATLLLFWALAAILAPVALGAARVLRPGEAAHGGGWFWGRAYPLLVLIGFTSPAVWIAARHLDLQTRGGLWVAILAAVLSVWLGLFVLLRSDDRVRGFCRASWTCSLVLALLAGGAAAVAAVSEGHPPPQPPAARAQPNILLVSIDSLRRDHLHCYGYARETSPTIDRLAREGTIFRTVVAPTSWTLPSHLTLLTALPPEAHGVVDDGMRLRGNALFLAQVLWRAGYATGGVVSAPYLDAGYGFGQGFDLYDDYTVAKASQNRSHQGTTSPALVDTVLRWLDGWDGGGRQRPFFLFVHMWDVHYDYAPPPPYDRMFDPDYRGAVTGENYEYGTQVHAGMDPRDLTHIVALYDGEIRFTDLYLGHLLDRLRAMGVLDDTVVVVTADHGDEFFEHGNKSHSKALYDETTLVPLVVRFPPRVPAGKVVDGQVRLMDVAPTILSLAGVSRPPDFGASAFGASYAAADLTPWITAPAGADPPALIAFTDLRTTYAPQPLAAVRTTSSKFIRGLRDQQSEELYDLAADPGEQVNLLRRDPSLATPLRQQLARWRDGWNGTRPLAEKVELSEEHEERLRALGYMH